MSDLPMIPDCELDFEADLVFTHNGEPFTGVAFEESPTLGRSEVTYHRGIQEGFARDWYPDGVLKGESHYVRGALHGLSKEYDAAGRLSIESWYEYGILVRRRRFDAAGVVVEASELEPTSAEARLLEGLRSTGS